MRYLIFLLLATSIILGGCLPEQTQKTYLLTETTNNADIDYQMLQNIDNIPPPYPAGGKYQIGDIKTKKGKYTVYKFISEYKGQKHPEEPKVLHDLLIIKVDKDKKIIDAYHYTLNWQDVPSFDLYQATNKDVYLKDGLKIKDLKLINIRTKEKLEEKATLDMLK